MKASEFKSVFLESTDFFSQVFFRVVESMEGKGLSEILDLKQESLLSFFCDISSIQDSFRFRAQRRAFLMAHYVIDEQGQLQKEHLDHLIHLLEQEGYVIYPKGLCDEVLLSHTLSILKKLKEDPALYKTILKFRAPLCHAGADELICDSLKLPHGLALTDMHIRKAVLSACLTSLRQNVGSCFATAPAIMIQKEQIEHLLTDLYELLMTGKLKRTFAGVEFSVPLSPSSGGGDLNKSIPIKEAQFSLGLIAAFEASGLLSSEMNWQEKSSRILEIITPFTREEKNVRDLIHDVLLDHFRLTQEDLELEKKKHLSFLKQKKLTLDTRATASLRKGQLCEKMLLLEKKALAAFKAVTDHALLKAWEFTLASFSEVKMEFSRWNLYASLGMNHEEPEGIGEVIYKALQGNLEEDQKKAEQYHEEYLIANDQLRATETLLKGASTESDIRRLKAEFNTRLYHMRACLEMRDEFQSKASHYSSFFSFLLKQYDEKFPEYFQEIYDAQMQDVVLKQYEDSPAGFRLVYKHGRSNAFLWSLIDGPEQYIDALVDFFLAVEPQIASHSDWEEAVQVTSNLTTLIVSQIRTEEFLKTALWRMAKAHQQPLLQDPIASLGKMEKKPWAYTSGGNMATLLKTYYKREGGMTEESRWVESPSDLLIFILDVLKTIPLSMVESLLLQQRGVLMSSPSHAFILYPSWDLIKKGWQEDLFTYTWVRDQVVLPGKSFYEATLLSLDEQSFLVEEFSKTLSVDILYRLKQALSSESVNIQTFRNAVLLQIGSAFKDQIDSFLYESIPLVEGRDLKYTVSLLLKEIASVEIDGFLDLLPEIAPERMSAKQVKECAKALYLASKGSICLSFDLHQKIAKRSEEIKLAPPAPFLFADTNWTNYYFGFVVNPGTGLLELWRLDKMGFQGRPMSTWEHWMNGEDRSSWTVFSRFFEYS